MNNTFSCISRGGWLNTLLRRCIGLRFLKGRWQAEDMDLACAEEGTLSRHPKERSQAGLPAFSAVSKAPESSRGKKITK